MGNTLQRRTPNAYQSIKRRPKCATGGLSYVPCSVPTKVTKTTIRSAFNSYFAQAVLGEDSSWEEPLKKLMKLILSQKYEQFEYTTDKTVMYGATYKAKIRIEGEERKLIIYKRSTPIISSEEFAFAATSEILVRLAKFWALVMLA